MSARTILAADVGGTKVLVGAVEVAREGLAVARHAAYPSAELGGLGEALVRFAAETGTRFERVAVGLCGPVVAGESFLPHLSWTVRAADLEAELGVPVTAVNDFVALGHGLDLAQGSERLQEGRPERDGPAALIGAGTGLGQALVAREGGRVVVHPSEAGHADFAPASELEDALVAWLRARAGRAPAEAVLSGAGLANVYAFLAEREGGGDGAVLDAADPAAEITARGDGDPLCGRALDVFCAAYGSEAANLALRCVATGGVFLAGGIAPRILPRLRGGAFLAAFRAKEPMHDLLARIPVSVVTDSRTALFGAARIAAAEAGMNVPDTPRTISER